MVNRAEVVPPVVCFIAIRRVTSSKCWLRWQPNYLKDAPVILAISVYYARHVGFSVFWDVRLSFE